MELPRSLKESLKQLYDQQEKTLKKESSKISQNYRFKKRDGSSLLSQKDEALAYALTRMPATYGAVASILSHLSKHVDLKEMHTVLDIGAGSGSASFALNECLDIYQFTCLEKENVMKDIGYQLMHDQSNLIDKTQWISFDITKDILTQKADIVIAAYMINELEENKKFDALMAMWESTHHLLIIVEPATPQHYQEMMRIRSWLLEKKAYLVAPCPHQEVCLLEDQWCHFTVRVARSKIHKSLKQGEVGYEDEKFTYLVFSKDPMMPVSSRILRHPIIENGRVLLKLCDKQGIHETWITRKNKELFKKAKKSHQGDSF